MRQKAFTVLAASQRASSLIALGTLAFLASPLSREIMDYHQTHITLQVDPAMTITDPGLALSAGDYTQIECLAQNIYFEARGESPRGMLAVSKVVFNRLHSGLFPNGICQIIYQAKLDANGKPLPGKCQFSWYCDGLAHTVKPGPAWTQAYTIAYNSYLYETREPDVTAGATYYHADYVSPDWHNLDRVSQIGQHIFYATPAPRNASGTTHAKAPEQSHALNH